MAVAPARVHVQSAESPQAGVGESPFCASNFRELLSIRQGGTVSNDSKLWLCIWQLHMFGELPAGIER